MSFVKVQSIANLDFWVAREHIVRMVRHPHAGTTNLVLSTGEDLVVRETPEEIMVVSSNTDTPHQNKLTDEEKEAIRSTGYDRGWLARDVSGCIYFYLSKPERGSDNFWYPPQLVTRLPGRLFKFVSMEDSEPTPITPEDLL